MDFFIRRALFSDLVEIRRVMKRAIETLQTEFLSPQEIEASHALMGLDTQLIADGTYYLVLTKDGGVLAGCGGWSRRTTLFGGDHTSGREDTLLDPAQDPARIRAMYTDPAFIRRGIGRLIITTCEDAARTEGFGRTGLMSTLAGAPLYKACGYTVVEDVNAETPSGTSVPLQRMEKTLI